MNRYCVETTLGSVHFLADSPRPAAVLFHGFRRSPANLLSWRDRIPGAAFACLPGHGGAPSLGEVSVRAWADAWTEAFRQLGSPAVVVGESLGAMVAMCLPTRFAVAVEPLLSTGNIWPQRVAMRRAKSRGVEIDASEEALFDGPYDWIFDRIAAPTTVIAGDVPLLPPRSLPTAPSLLTDADFGRYAAHPLVTAHRVPGGHLLMDENPEGVADLMRRFLAGQAARAEIT